MDKYYTSEKHTQILIALLKEHGVKKVIVSPGTANISFVASIQHDPYFEIYSSSEERSAAFIACGLATESGEPVALSCTGSTASRNYVPGLTEAFYRHLPIVAITSTQHLGRAGSLYPQHIDRSTHMVDLVKESISVESIYSEEDEWACELNINRALIAMRKDGGGPVHINLVTEFSRDYSVKKLPDIKMIRFFGCEDKMPDIKHFNRIAILVGVHRKWSDLLKKAVDEFCCKYNAVVLTTHSSNYSGDYGVAFPLINGLLHYENELDDANLVIHIGDTARYVSGMKKAEMWRVSLDGKVADPEKKLSAVFQMKEESFFEYYNGMIDTIPDYAENCYAKQWQQLYDSVLEKVKELPFSNVWIAKNMLSRLPSGCVLHLGGSNTARAWNYFKLPKDITCFSNDGTMGIDGQVSALIGESLASPDKLHFGVVGDLTFFYDMNSLGNRHIGNNIRLLVINNGGGAEFKLYSHIANDFGNEADDYIAASGHFGNKSPELIKDYVQNLGYKYLSASRMDEFEQVLPEFLDTTMDKSVVFEVFTNYKDESDAVYIMNHLMQPLSGLARETAKETIRKVAGEKAVNAVRKIIRGN